MTATEAKEALKEVKLGLSQLLERFDDWPKCIQQNDPVEKDATPFN